MLRERVGSTSVAGVGYRLTSRVLEVSPSRPETVAAGMCRRMLTRAPMSAPPKGRYPFSVEGHHRFVRVDGVSQ